MNQRSKNILLIDKPTGITSYDVIRRLKEKYPGEKIGHAGTLDPRATGLLLVGIGKGTKKLHDLVGLDKEYVADILIGVKTNTGDLDGEIIEREKVESIESNKAENVLKEMKGVLTLPVSVYSAIKQGGEPLYKKARRGEKVEPPERNMEIKEAELLSLSKSDFDKGEGVVVRVRFMVGSGTYIRSIAEEFGRRLGMPATLAELRRTKIGPHSVTDAEHL